MNHQKIENFLLSVERSANQKFRLRDEIAWLLRVTEERAMENVFEDVLFFSKFITRATGVLRREGIDSDSTVQLQSEFKVNLEKLHTLLRTIIKEAAEPERGNFIARFLHLSPGSMENLLSLAKELTWIKNYNLDKAR